LITRDALAQVSNINWAASVDQFARRAADPRWFGQPVHAQRAVTLIKVGAKTFDSRVVALDGQCQHLSFTAGRCPQSAAETMITDRTAATVGWHVGQRIEVKAGRGGLPVHLTVAGTYQPTDPRGEYWAACG
jgi:hypothetical protein